MDAIAAVRVPCMFPVVLCLGCTWAVDFDDPMTQLYETRMGLRMGYSISPETLAKTFAMRSPSAGIAHIWVVRPGEVLDQYARAHLTGAFEFFEPVSTDAPRGEVDYVTTLEIPLYSVDGFRAALAIRAIVRDPGGNVVFDETEYQVGSSGATRVFFLGAFGAKSAIRRSTHSAMTPAMQRLVSKMRSTWKAWANPSL